MDSMQVGDIGLVEITGWVGFLIRLGQWLAGGGFANFEHAFIYIGNGRVVEAEPGGARIANLSEYAGRTVRVIPAPSAAIGAKVATLAQGCTLADGGKGVPYSALDYDYIAIRRRFRWFAWMLPWLKKAIATDGHMICSQLADRCASYAGWYLFSDGRWDGDVMPADLDQLWLKLPVKASFVVAA